MDKNLKLDALAKKSETASLCHSDQREESCFYRQWEDPSLLVGMTSWTYCECLKT